MSSGHYNYKPKIEFQNTVLPQMTSDVYLPSFHFGASQVPHALNEKPEFIGAGINHNSLKFRPTSVKDTTVSLRNKIYIPMHMK